MKVVKIKTQICTTILLNHEFAKPGKKAKNRQDREKEKASRILDRTRRKARIRINIHGKTPITASTKLEFLFRYQEKHNGTGVLRQMKADGLQRELDTTTD